MGIAGELLTKPDFSFQAFALEESRLRTQYLRIGRCAPGPTPSATPLDTIIKKSAVLLELFVVSACHHEAFEENSIHSFGRSRESRSHLLERVRLASGLNPMSVIRDAVYYLSVEPGNAATSVRLGIPAIVRAMRSILEACPIDDLESLAAIHGIEDWGHRCRVAYDRIHAFVLRNDPEEEEKLRIVGRGFALGELELREVASLLNLHPVDAIALLESRGFARSLSVIRLPADQRIERLNALRSQRMAKKSDPPRFARETIARDVIASERMEGIDARAWIAREAS